MVTGHLVRQWLGLLVNVRTGHRSIFVSPSIGGRYPPGQSLDSLQCYYIVLENQSLAVVDVAMIHPIKHRRPAGYLLMFLHACSKPSDPKSWVLSDSGCYPPGSLGPY